MTPTVPKVMSPMGQWLKSPRANHLSALCQKQTVRVELWPV